MAQMRQGLGGGEQAVQGIQPGDVEELRHHVRGRLRLRASRTDLLETRRVLRLQRGDARVQCAEWQTVRRGVRRRRLVVRT